MFIKFRFFCILENANKFSAEYSKAIVATSMTAFSLNRTWFSATYTSLDLCRL